MRARGLDRLSRAMGTAVRQPFDAEYRPLVEGAPRFGQVALLPWDEEIFGFRVADYRPGDLRDSADSREPAESLERWSGANDVELVGCRVPADSPALSAFVQAMGFRFVEAQLRATVPRLLPKAFPRTRLTLRHAEMSDRARILEIAETAFSFGRYHADPRFPRSLADRRYRIWMERALADSVSSCRVLVIGPPGRPAAFLHAEVGDGRADLRLAAADPADAGIAGAELIRGALREFSAEGATHATALFSAANTPVANIYASLGFRFHDPQLVFHWHRPGSRRLVSPAEALAPSRPSHGPTGAR